MKLKKLAAACTLALGAMVVSTAPAQAQISGDVVRIGIITDMSSLYADIDGPGGIEAIKMAIADMGGAINGKKIEVIYADHQNKPDLAAGKAREWFDTQGVDMLIGGTNSGTSLAMAKVAQEKKKLVDQARHLVLEAPHPSPLSAHRGFFGSRPFSKTNAWLAKHGLAPIDWRL